MKQLAANLRTQYQCRTLWLFHFVYLGILFAIGTSKELANFDFIAITAFAFLHLCYGLTIGFLIYELFRKPFSYCLPGRNKSAQLMTLLILISIILIFSLISGSFNEGLKTGYNFYLISIGLLSLNYWLGVSLILRRGFGGIFIFI